MPSAVVTRRTTKFSTCRASSEGILRFSAQFRNILLCRGPGYLWVGRRSYIILHPLQWWSNGEQCLTCECEGDVIPLVCKSPILWALINAADGDKETHHDGSWLIISKRGQRRQTPAHEEAESGHQVARWDSHGMVLFQNSHLSFQCYFKVTDIPHSTFHIHIRIRGATQAAAQCVDTRLIRLERRLMGYSWMFASNSEIFAS